MEIQGTDRLKILRLTHGNKITPLRMKNGVLCGNIWIHCIKL